MAKKLTFEEWQARVNKVLINRVDLGIDDLPDYDYWTAWNCGESPLECARDVLENAMNY